VGIDAQELQDPLASIPARLKPAKSSRVCKFRQREPAAERTLATAAQDGRYKEWNRISESPG